MKGKLTMKAAREKAGLFQRELAQKVGISLMHLLRIEHGTSDPTVTVAIRIARTLGCAVEDIFPVSDAISRKTSPTLRKSSKKS